MEQYQIEIFTDILCNDIINTKIRKNVIDYFYMEVSPEFWTLPAAMHDHHPLDERGEGGLVLHTKRVKAMAMWLARAEQLNDYDRDLLVASAVIHDTKKPFYDHADRLKDTMLMPEIIEIAKMHMGPWFRPERWPNVCMLGRLLYYADFIASREGFTMNPNDMICLSY